MDGAVTTGNVVSRHFDSLLAKVIATAPTFPKAVQKMQRALSEFQIRGIKTSELQHPRSWVLLRPVTDLLKALCPLPPHASLLRVAASAASCPLPLP
jgi:hypothetical protein